MTDTVMCAVMCARVRAQWRNKGARVHNAMDFAPLAKSSALGPHAASWLFEYSPRQPLSGARTCGVGNKAAPYRGDFLPQRSWPPPLVGLWVVSPWPFFWGRRSGVVGESRWVSGDCNSTQCPRRRVCALPLLERE